MLAKHACEGDIGVEIIISSESNVIESNLCVVVIILRLRDMPISNCFMKKIRDSEFQTKDRQ